MNYLTTEQVLFLHHRIIKETGGSHGVTSLALLQSAIGRPRASFTGEDLYPDMHRKAAALIESIIRNHPFVDGNKRTGIAAGMLFLRRNGCRLDLSNEKAEALALAVATGEMGLDDITQVLRRACPTLDAR